MRSVYGFCLSLALALFPGLVEAHAIGLSSGEYRIEDQRLVATLAFARTEWLAVIPELDVDADGDLSSGEIIAGKAALGEVLLPGVEVRSAGSACPGKVNRIEAIEGNGLEIESSYECPASDRVFEVKLTLFDKLSFGHRHLAHQASTPADATQVLFQTQPEFLVSSDSSLSPAATDVASVFQLGVSHILTGYDHLVFLLGLILVGRRLMPLMILVSAFTAGHMLSFGLAALDLVVPDPGLIEPAIALTIAYVGVENWLVKDLSHRWVLAFPFGLLHGFGFGGAMRELSVPSDQLLSSLISFNLGVEAGQLAVLAILLPTLWWLRKASLFERYGTQILSSLIVVAGVGWFVERVWA